MMQTPTCLQLAVGYADRAGVARKKTKLRLASMRPINDVKTPDLRPNHNSEKVISHLD